ncbi:MAG: hypothetical protein IRZ03_16560 [Acidobacterium ailaaui]|nr:hypothetical protein [Pseudacidobacterium ailaaui]
MKTESINFRNFMAGNYRKPALPTITYAGLMPTITPQNLFPFHDGGFTLFFASASAIVLVAILEHELAHRGLTEIAHVVASFGRFVLPAIAYGLIAWLFFFGLRGI